MPAPETLERFIALIEANAHVEAVEQFYTADASMQENQAPPREGGRAALMAREASVLDRSESVVTELLGGPLVSGDQVAIRWRFSFVFKNGSTMRMEEVAWQTWRGEKIAEETFFYDPAQRQAR